MDDSKPEAEMVTIRCPSCGQRFKVGPELEGRMVECGTCDHRFRVEESVMIRSRKFYPGERHDPSLQRFSRVPLRSSPLPDIDIVSPPPDPDPRALLEPVSPLRVILGFAGVGGAVVVALILMFGGVPGGMLDGVPLPRRLVLAGFTAVLAWILLALANPAQRLKAVFGGLGITVVLFAMPFLFTQGLPSEEGVPSLADGSLRPGPAALGEDPDADPGDSFAALKKEIGYSKMAEAIESYGIDGESQGKTAVGVWLRDARLYNKEQIVDYLMRTTGAGERSWAYSRPPSDYLMVLYDVSPDLERIRTLCERFGTVPRVIKELQVVEVFVDNDRFVQGPLNKLQNPEDPSFYELNRRELDSIDLQRAGAAAKRLAGAEPRVFRNDIVKRLQELFAEGALDVKRDVARALIVWAVPGDGSVEMVRETLIIRHREDDEIPRVMVEFLVKSRDAESVPLIHDLWLRDASEWETLYGDMGAMIEQGLLASFNQVGPRQKMSAARLLGRVGTEASLPILESAEAGAIPELRVTIEQAIRSIRNR